MSDDNYQDDLMLFPFPMTGELFGDWHGIWRVRTRPVATPIGEPCISCHEAIREGEAGGMVYRRHAPPTTHGTDTQIPPALSTDRDGKAEVHFDHDGSEVTASAPVLVPIHRACLLLDVMGHEYGVCVCTKYDGIASKRAAAVELERRIRADEGAIARAAAVRVRGKPS